MDQDYASTLEYLYGRLPFFSRQGARAYQKDLGRTLALCERLGNPQQSLPVLHIAGTNGKGSTAHMLAALLIGSGYRTGLYTSPHLVDFRERIRWQGLPIPASWVVDFVRDFRRDIEEISPSFFELTVVMALQYFAEQRPDFVIMEAGLGGRLDSTNVVHPLLSIITNISLDHQDLLGDTLEAIAREKAGIIKPGVPVIIGQRHPQTDRVFLERALHCRSTLFYAEDQWDLVRLGPSRPAGGFRAVHRSRGQSLELNTDLKGSYQYHNLRTVLMAMDCLVHALGYSLPPEKALAALAQVGPLTGLRGRWEVLQQDPLIMVDVAHNPAGMEAVKAQWETVEAEHRHWMIGMVADKDIDTVLDLLPEGHHYHFVAAQVPRALPAEVLARRAEEKGRKGRVYASVGEALDTLSGELSARDALLVTGSFFVAGEAIAWSSIRSKELFPTTLK